MSLDSETKDPPNKQLPAKLEENLPKFEKDMSDKIVAKFGEKTQIAFVKPDRIQVNVKKEDIKDVAEYVRDELGFDHAESVTGTDFPDDKEI